MNILTLVLFLTLGSIKTAHIRGLSRLYTGISHAESSIPGYTRIPDIESLGTINVVDALPLIYIPNPDTELVDTNWIIPRTQFDFSLPIYAAIFGLSTCWDKKGLEYQIAIATYLITILICGQLYFGFCISISIRCDNFCFIRPSSFRANLLDNGSFVPFHRWALVPFSWITQGLLLIPEDTYSKLDHFPSRIFYLYYFFFNGFITLDYTID